MLLVNQWLAELKAALEAARLGKQRGRPLRELRKTLDAVLDAKALSCKNPDNDRWRSRVVAPREERLREFQ